MENSRCCLRWIKASDARPLGTRAAICAASARLTAPLSENYRYGEERVAKRRKKVEDEVGWVMLEERLERWWRWKMRNMRKYAKREGGEEEKGKEEYEECKECKEEEGPRTFGERRA
ncbi:MAG: hypothetical protein MMC23_008511 [Stictis urceolatum]|nr:hypothetical protein [Stictis urceolata]